MGGTRIWTALIKHIAVGTTEVVAASTDIIVESCVMTARRTGAAWVGQAWILRLALDSSVTEGTRTDVDVIRHRHRTDAGVLARIAVAADDNVAFDSSEARRASTLVDVVTGSVVGSVSVGAGGSVQAGC